MLPPRLLLLVRAGAHQAHSALCWQRVHDVLDHPKVLAIVLLPGPLVLDLLSKPSECDLSLRGAFDCFAYSRYSIRAQHRLQRPQHPIDGPGHCVHRGASVSLERLEIQRVQVLASADKVPRVLVVASFLTDPHAGQAVKDVRGLLTKLDEELVP